MGRSRSRAVCSGMSKKVAKALNRVLGEYIEGGAPTPSPARPPARRPGPAEQPRAPRRPLARC